MTTTGIVDEKRAFWDISTPIVQARNTIRWKKLAFISAAAVAFLVIQHGRSIGFLCRDHQGDGAHWAVHYTQTTPPGTEKNEKLFLSVPDTSSAAATSRQFTATPHIAGTDEDLRTAKDLLAIIQAEFGIPSSKDGEQPIFDAGSEASQKATTGIQDLEGPSAWIDTYYPLLNAPTGKSTLEILDEDGKAVWKADLTEKVPKHGSSHEEYEYADAIPAFHGYSKNGTGQGEVVYANFASKEDFEELISKGVDINGKVVLARYGSIFRGLKVKFAQEHGASAILLFDDPSVDGAVTIANGYKPYPAGPARNPTAIQRGSAQFLSIYPGDPTTPGYPSYPNSTRTEGKSIPSIPSLPISWENAQRIMDGPNVVKVVNSVNSGVGRIWNTMAVIPGHIKDEIVVLGNHRDAWVMGASDPTSGTVSMVEVIRGYGTLLRQGWKPLRTILFASWDAEEYGLVGSTEYGEDFKRWIKQHVVAYLNLDVSVSGSKMTISASPSLVDVARQVASSIPHPGDANRSLWDMRNDEGPFSGPIALDVQRLFGDASKASSNTEVGALGSGSDYTVFLQHIGIASVDQGSVHASHDAAYHYHSVYDSHHWLELYGDVGFKKHVALAQHLGLLGMKIIDSVILPLNTTRYCEELVGYVDKIEAQATDASISLNLKTLRKSIAKLEKSSRALDKQKDEAEKRLRKLHKRWRESQEKQDNENLSQSPQKRTIRNFRLGKAGAGTKLHSRSLLHPNHHSTHGPGHDDRRRRKLLKRIIKAAKRVQGINKKLATFESGFISSDGIRDREWYKHLGVAPGKNLGYGATTLPAIAEAISEYKNATLAQQEVERLQHLLCKLNRHMRK